MYKLHSFNIEHNANNYHFAHVSVPTTKQDDYYRHSHTRYELYVFFAGNAEFIIEDRIFQMTPGTILLIPPNTYHYAALKDSDTAYDRLVINFDRVFVFPELHPFLDGASNPYQWSREKYDPYLRDLEHSIALYASRDKALLIQIFLNRLLIDLKYLKKSTASSQMLNPTVTQILAYINEHIHEPLSLKTISENVFLNQSYLSQLFSAYMKIGVMDYVKQKKIYLAEEMIHGEGVSPTEAGKRLGFVDYSTFYRLYKKYLGEAPSAPQT